MHIHHDKYRLIHTNEIWIRNGKRINQMKKNKIEASHSAALAWLDEVKLKSERTLDTFFLTFHLLVLSSYSLNERDYFELFPTNKKYPLLFNYSAIWSKVFLLSKCAVAVS